MATAMHLISVRLNWEEAMPFIRLYSSATSLRAKRRIAGQLISIAQRSFELPQDPSHSVTVQFLPPQVSRPEYSAVVEVSGHNLEPMKMVRFVGAVAPVLGEQLRQGPLRRLFGIDEPRKLVAIEFSPVDAEHRATTGEAPSFEIRTAA
jgi:hypothetical protein